MMSEMQRYLRDYIQRFIENSQTEALEPLTDEISLSPHGTYIFMINDAMIEQLKSGVLLVFSEEYNTVIGYRHDPT